MTSKFWENIYFSTSKRLQKFERSGLSLLKVMLSVPVLLTHPVYASKALILEQLNLILRSRVALLRSCCWVKFSFFFHTPLYVVLIQWCCILIAQHCRNTLIKLSSTQFNLLECHIQLKRIRRFYSQIRRFYSIKLSIRYRNN